MTLDIIELEHDHDLNIDKLSPDALPIPVREALPEVLAFLTQSQSTTTPIGHIDFSVRTSYYDDNTTHGDHYFINYCKAGDPKSRWRDEELDDVPGIRRFERLYSDLAAHFEDHGNGEGDVHSLHITPRYALRTHCDGEDEALSSWSIHSPQARCPAFNLPTEAEEIITDACKALKMKRTALLVALDDSEWADGLTGISAMTGNALREIVPEKIDGFLSSECPEILVTRLPGMLMLHGLSSWDRSTPAPVFAIVETQET